MDTFEIDEQYLVDVVDRKTILVDGRESHMTGRKDHPQFTELRHMLAVKGFIAMENGWVNGDVVRKPFTLNGYEFAAGDRFPCAVAMGFKFKMWRKRDGR